MRTSDLTDPQFLKNLRSQGIVTAENLSVVNFVVKFCEDVGGEAKVDWVPTRDNAWSVSLPVEIKERGMRRGAIGWGDQLIDAFDQACLLIRSGAIFAHYDRNNKRRWQWSNKAGGGVDRWTED